MMTRTQRLPCLIAFLVFGLLISTAIQAQSLAPASEEAALRALIEQYVEAQATKNIIKIMGSWTLRSPEAIPHLEKIQQNLESEAYVFTNLTISNIKIVTVRATLRVEAEVAITQTATGESRKQHLARNFALLKEEGNWRIWWEVPATQNVEAFLKKGAEWKTSTSRPVEEQFADALFEASPTDRDTLLAENQELMTAALVKALLKKSEAFHAPSSAAKVLEGFRLAEILAERLGDQPGAARARLGQAELHRQSRNYPAALTLFEKVAAQFAELNEQAQVAKAYDSLGTIYLEQRDFERALESYKRALAVYTALNHRTGIADANEELGSVYYEEKKYPQALEFFEKALKLREAAGKKVEVSATLNNMGNTYYHQENYETAIEYYQKAIPGFEANNDKLAIAETLNNLGSAYYAQGNYDMALEAYEKALARAEELNNKYTAATSLFGLGLVQYVRGDFGLALDALNKNFAILERLGNRERMPPTLRSLGLTHLRRQNYDLALEAYLKCLKLYEEQTDKAYKLQAATLVIEIGNILYTQDKYDLALGRYHQALAYFGALQESAGIAAAHKGIATVYYARNNLDAALEGYQKALALYESLGDKDEIAFTFDRLASVHYSRSDFAKGLDFADRATRLAKQINNQPIVWQSRYTAANAYRGLGQFEEARKAVEESIATIETMRTQWIDDEQAQAFYQDKTAPYVVMMELLLAQNKSVEAFAFSELIKVHRLWDLLHKVRLKITKTMTAPEMEQEPKLNRGLIALKRQFDREQLREKPGETRILSLTARLEKARQDVEAFKTKLYTAHPQLKTLRGEASAMGLTAMSLSAMRLTAISLSATSLEDTSRLLDTRSAWLEFVVTNAKTYLFVLSKEPPAGAPRSAPVLNLKAYVLNIGRPELTERSGQFKTAIVGQTEQVKPLARELYEVLLKPANAQLSGKDYLVVVPDDVLWNVPFQALQSADDRYLVEDAALVYAPSLAAYQEMNRPRATTRPPAISLLAFANPLLSEETKERARLFNKEQSFAPAVDIENELKMLSQLYGEASRVFTGAEASEEKSKAEIARARVVQIAARALLSDNSPLYSSILLAQTETDKKQDGLLQAWELLQLNSLSEVIVMTACELPSASNGDGLTTMAWSWFVAGSSSLVLNQWSSESGNPDFILELHRQLKQPLAPAKALQQAARVMLKGPHSQPFYWSRFLVIGAGK